VLSSRGKSDTVEVDLVCLLLEKGALVCAREFLVVPRTLVKELRYRDIVKAMLASGADIPVVPD
jgi:hypothetical protein